MNDLRALFAPLSVPLRLWLAIQILHWRKRNQANQSLAIEQQIRAGQAALKYLHYSMVQTNSDLQRLQRAQQARQARLRA